jgi:hypothetical protein
MSEYEAEEEVKGFEVFAIYGFRLKFPETWRVEFNPKGTRDKGDVALHSPKRNKLFVSWGPLAEAIKRFGSIENQRDWGITVLEKTRGVQSVSVTESREVLLCGHRALATNLVISAGMGFRGRVRLDKQMNSVHLHCPNTSRYYVIYNDVNIPDEYAEFPKLFDRVIGSFRCHETEA